MMMPKFLSLIFFFLMQIVTAQERTAKLEMVENSGFHQILITPEIRSSTRNNLDYIRLLDGKKNEVPYILFEKRNPEKHHQSFEILSKNAISNVSTSIIISNKDSKKLDHLDLKIANTDVWKKYNISGSNDQKEWFGLVDNQVISDLSDPKSTFVVRQFPFPVNQYKYLKFTFIDKDSLPVNVLEASSQDVFQNYSVPIVLGGFAQNISQNKHLKQSMVQIKFENPQVIDGLKFEISGTNFYSRNAEISVPKTRNYKKNTEVVNERIASVQLRSKTANSFSIPETLTDEIMIIIDNQDNLPLKIEKIEFYQNPISILADLNKDEKYSLIINPKLRKPNYDLAEMNINPNEIFPVATIGKLDQQSAIKANETEKSFWQTSLFMWICILVAIFAIGYFAITMVKDMNKEK